MLMMTCQGGDHRVTANGARGDLFASLMQSVAPRRIGMNPWPGTHGQDAHATDSQRTLRNSSRLVLTVTGIGWFYVMPAGKPTPCGAVGLRLAMFSGTGTSTLDST
jgi:hypothetical protein